MLIQLDHALTDARAKVSLAGRPFKRDDLDTVIIVGAVECLRPRMMTIATIIAGLLPILWACATGSAVMTRITVLKSGELCHQPS